MRWAALFAAVALSMAAAQGAAAAPHAPVLRGCAAETAASGCRALGGGSLAGASALGVSSRRVYVGAYGAGSVLALGRGLSFAGCVASDGAPRCAAAPDYALDGTGGVAVGGGDVYATSGLGRSVTRIEADPFAFGACLCAEPLLAGASEVAVDGRDVYVTSFDAAAVTWLRRGADGSLRRAGCIADGGAFGCAAPPGNVLEGAAGIAIAGRDVYVTAFRSGAVVRFSRRASGALAYRGCIADSGANGCRRARTPSLVGATGIVASGRRVYVAAQTGSVSVFARPLRFLGAVRRPSLAGASGIAVHGKAVFVAAARAGAITRLRGPSLRFAGCVAHKLRGCARGPAAALDGVYAVAARGRDVYAASPTRASVSRWRIR